jgi:hypothetical protein
VINFYQAWKEDKEYGQDAPKRKSKPAFQCKICGKRVNGLKDHVEGCHGVGMWKRYLAAEAEIEQQQLDTFRRLL